MFKMFSKLTYKNLILKRLMIILSLLIFNSCTENPDDLLKKGFLNQAIDVYKEQLRQDYNNPNLRRKITFTYFDIALVDISEGDIFSAKNNIEIANIYADKKDVETKKRYSSILCDLGELYIDLGSDNNNGSDTSLKKKRHYDKGISLINESVKIYDKNNKGIKILSNLNENRAEQYYNKGVSLYNRWFENQEVETLIFESRDNLNKAIKLNYSKSKDSKKLLEKIKENLVSLASKNDLYSFKVTDIIYNKRTRYLAINMRFFNNEINGYRAVDPKQFTLYDSNGNKFKPYKNIEELSGYKNLMRRRRLDAQRSFKGLLVFNLGKKRIKKFKKLIWVSSKGEIAKKEFPNKDITKIKLSN